jgi:two-component system invasion response regulator UvrY
MPATHVCVNLDVLTPRQRQVFSLIGEGKSYAEIARGLHIAPPSVTRHRNNLMRKLRVTTKADLLRLAVRVELERNGAIPREGGT